MQKFYTEEKIFFHILQKCCKIFCNFFAKKETAYSAKHFALQTTWRGRYFPIIEHFDWPIAKSIFAFSQSKFLNLGNQFWEVIFYEIILEMIPPLDLVAFVFMILMFACFYYLGLNFCEKDVESDYRFCKYNLHVNGKWHWHWQLTLQS